MQGSLGPSGHSPEIGAGCGAECLALQGRVLRAVMLMLGAFLTGVCGTGSGDPARLSQNAHPCMAWHGQGCRSFGCSRIHVHALQ